MFVKELIEELKKCNPSDIVMYDARNALINEDKEPDLFDDTAYGIEEVQIGAWTTKGMVFLCDELIPTVVIKDDGESVAE